MTSIPAATPDAPPARALLLPLLALLWVVAPLWLGFAGIITAAPFFGEQPTPAEQTQSTVLLLSAGASAVLLPLVGALIARSLRWRKTAVGFGVATALGVAASTALVLVMVTPSA